MGDNPSTQHVIALQSQPGQRGDRERAEQMEAAQLHTAQAAIPLATVELNA